MKKQTQESLISTLASIAAPLLQLIAVVSISLSEQLRLTKLLIRPDILPLANFFIILLTLASIGVIATWQNNAFAIRMSKRQPDDQTSIPFNDAKTTLISNLWKVFLFIEIPALVIFLGTLLIDTGDKYQKLLPMLQYVSYISFMYASGIILFMWLQDFQQTRSRPKIEDFIPNTLNSLRNRGMLNEKQVIISRSILLNDNTTKLVKAEIGNQEYIFTIDFNGTLIHDIWKEQDAPQNIKAILNPQTTPHTETTTKTSE